MASKLKQIVNFSDHSSYPAPRRSYDVFLSFRGEDTRDAFAYYLYKAFVGKGIHTFRDDDEIEAGKQVNDELMEAIIDSKFSVLVISENYASSSWCLNELVKILESRETLGQIVYAAFYHVNPADVRRQKGKFGEGFSEAVSKNQKNSQRWKKALEKIAGFKGWVYPSPQYETEEDFIEALTDNIFTKLKDAHPCHFEGLFGMASPMEDVIKLLNLESNKARIVGLWGMGGLGKTTIARAVYDSISWQFKGCSFIENVRDVASRSGLTAIQEQIISDTLKVKGMKVASVKGGTDILKQRVRFKKVLIVLDDVDESIEIESLIGDYRRFNPGSRFIITTRDRQCLTVSRAVHVYEVKKLNKDKAKELFKSKAFAKNGETKKYRRLINRAVRYADGFPLALKVLGSFLLNLTFNEWKGALKRLKQTPGDRVLKSLRISYDGLDRKDKDIFLDISCFFRGKYKDEVISVLGSCGFNPEIGVENLVRKSLLIILENNRVWMHDLLQKMGWTIVWEESIKEPGKRSRLWHHDDIKRALFENTGTDEIEGIFDTYPAFGAEDLELSPNAFANMTKLRVLKISYTCPSIDLPNSLRYLHWHCYPLEKMPSKFQPEHLVELHLTNSCIEQLWHGNMDLPKLTLLDLRHSTYLTKSPEFNGFPNLEKLILEGCTALQNLDPSIKDLKKLTILILKDCSSLKFIPYGIGSQCLKSLRLSGCIKLSNILERFRDLKQLLELYLDGTGITKVPKSIGNSTELLSLNLSHCEKLKHVPSSIGQLKKLKMLMLIRCSSLNKLPQEVGLIESLEILDLSYSRIRKLPSSVARLKNLKFLSLHGCNGYPFPLLLYSLLSIFLPTWNFTTLVLPSLLGFDSLTSLDLSFCRLVSVPESISCCLFLKVLLLSGNMFERLPSTIKDLNNLEKLWLRKCKRLKELPELPSTVRHLITSGCESLKTICSPSIFKDARWLCFSNCSKLVDNVEIKTLMEYNFLFNQIKVNNHSKLRAYTGPGSKIPKWFTYQNVGACIKLHLPPHDLYPSKLLGFAVSAIVSTKSDDCNIGVQISVGDTILEGGWAFLFFKNVVDVFILYLPIQGFMVDSINEGDIDIKFCFVTAEYDTDAYTCMVDEVSDPAPEVKSCGARLIYEGVFDDIVESDQGPTLTSTKIKICFSLFALFIFCYFLYITSFVS